MYIKQLHLTSILNYLALHRSHDSLKTAGKTTVESSRISSIFPWNIGYQLI